MNWTKELDNLLLAKWSDGMHLNSIATLLGTTQGAIYTRLSRLRAFPENAPLKRSISLPRYSMESEQLHMSPQEFELKSAPAVSGTGLTDADDEMTFASVPFVHARANQCKYPLWSDLSNPPVLQKMVCGAPTISGRSWCESCRAKIYASPAQHRITNVSNEPGFPTK